ARPVGVEGFYERARAAGYGYGSAFQGLRNVWRHGEDTLAEVSLPDEVAEQVGRFGIHPVLLDAAMQPVLLAGRLDGAAEDGVSMLLPFTWSGVSLWAGGATRVRVRLSPRPGGVLRVMVADTTGAPVLSADAVVLRETSAQQLRAAGGAHGSHGLIAVDWTALPADGPSTAGVADWAAGDVAVLGDVAADLADAVRYADMAALFTAVEA
ncbi:polyketide synthase dehydratase domain-containing protein, partial [Streptomyces sp. 2MCAF27]